MMKAVLCFLVVFGVAFADPDSDFASCCKDKGVTESCQAFCTYQLTPDEILQAFVDGKCSVENDRSPFNQCVENLKDNTECCKAAGVGADASLSDCLELCDGTKPLAADKDYSNCGAYKQAVFDCGKNAHFRKITW